MANTTFHMIGQFEDQHFRACRPHGGMSSSSVRFPGPHPSLFNMASTSGPILVTGGCGFIGHHIVQALLKDPTAGPITVISRNPTTNVFDGATYIAGDIANPTFVNKIVTDVKPQIIFHTAAPRPVDETVNENTWKATNVTGTRNLIKAAKASPDTGFFIHSSTVNVIQGDEHVNAAESSRPYWKPTDRAIPYWRSKAEAEQIVLAANSESLKTVSIRPCLVVGLQEHSLIPAQLDALKQRKHRVQLGDNTNQWDFVSADNCAQAHLLAMHALLDPSKAQGKVDGEAFNITDNNPIPFWDLSRIIWRTADDQTNLENVTVIPAWVAMTMASVAEFAYGVMFFGSKSPELNRHVVIACTHTFTYDISKAQKVLGYNPIKHTEQVVKEATEWEMQRRAKTGQT
jgi:sterol-4alpha-carboxylate 3-dehydrogenase (decarboxylating)